MPVAQRSVAEMSVDQVAALLRVNRMTVTRFWDPRYTAPAAQLRAIRYGGVWRVTARELASFMNRNTITPEGEEPLAVAAVEIPRLRTLEEAHEESGLPLSWLKLNCRLRRIPHIRAGRAQLMTPEQILRAVEIASVSDSATDALAADRAAYASGRRASRTSRRQAA